MPFSRASKDYAGSSSSLTRCCSSKPSITRSLPFPSPRGIDKKTLKSHLNTIQGDDHDLEAVKQTTAGARILVDGIDAYPQFQWSESSHHLYKSFCPLRSMACERPFSKHVRRDRKRPRRQDHHLHRHVDCRVPDSCKPLAPSRSSVVVLLLSPSGPACEKSQCYGGESSRAHSTG